MSERILIEPKPPSVDDILELVKAAFYFAGWEELPIPERSHTGSCGPEAGCDATCMDAYYVSQQNASIRRIRKALIPWGYHEPANSLGGKP